MTTVTDGLQVGQMVEGYQVIDQAPVEHIYGSQQREFDGHLVTGRWSDPWWLYDPARGWAIARRWKSKETKVMIWTRIPEPCRQEIIPARDELVITPWEGEA
jgi:hypothetical protein